MDAELKAKTPQACLNCFLDAAVCAGKNCIEECIDDANAPKCLKCRIDKKCDTKVFGCAKIVNPF
jgi:hypothetical protein